MCVRESEIECEIERERESERSSERESKRARARGDIIPDICTEEVVDRAPKCRVGTPSVLTKVGTD